MNKCRLETTFWTLLRKFVVLSLPLSWITNQSPKSEGISAVFLPSSQLPVESLTSNGSAGYKSCLHNSCTRPLPCSERHSPLPIQHLPTLQLLVKPFWFPVFWILPFFLIVMTPIYVDCDLQSKIPNHIQLQKQIKGHLKFEYRILIIFIFIIDVLRAYNLPGFLQAREIPPAPHPLARIAVEGSVQGGASWESPEKQRSDMVVWGANLQ